MSRAALLLAPAAVLAALLAGELAAPALPEPPPAPHPDRPPAPAAAPAAATAPDEDALDDRVRDILARPLLHPSRRPPVPAGAAAAVAGPAGAELPRLAGVLIGPAGRRAIFAPAAGKPLVLAEGQSLGRYTIRSIAAGGVVLAGSEGSRTLRPTHLGAPATAGGRP